MKYPDIEYLDLPEDLLRSISQEAEPCFEEPVDYPIRYALRQNVIGEWVDSNTPDTHNAVPVNCPYDATSPTQWKIPLEDGPVFEVQFVRSRKTESGAWNWVVHLKKVCHK